MSLPLRDPHGLLDAALAGRLAALETLGQALSSLPGARFADVVMQDEYTHDVVVAMGERWLAFDAT